MPTPLDFLEIGASREDAESTIILMHGLGADGHDFADVAQVLFQSARPKRWRFILPHAGKIPVTINMGTRMPAWYDILSLSHSREVDWSTVASSQAQIESLIAAETAPKVILAGFSQGGAMALHVGLRNQHRVAGILSMSGYLMQSDDHPVPSLQKAMPIHLLHGNADEVVPIVAARAAVESLQAEGYEPEYKCYVALGHSVSQEEIRDVFEWLSKHA